MSKARHGRGLHRQFQALESRTMFNAAPIAPGFPTDNDAFPGWDPNTIWPRFGAVSYDGQTPTYDITYEQMMALSQASDPDGDTVYFLYRANALPSGTTASADWGLLGEDGSPLLTTYGNQAPTFDTNNDGVPDGPYVLEPGETWHWRGAPNMSFTGLNQGPAWGGPGDVAILVSVADSIRPLDDYATSYISFTGNRVIQYNRTDSESPFQTYNAGHTGTVTRSYEEILAALRFHGTITDPEGATPLLVIAPGMDIYSSHYSIEYGTLMVGGANLNQYVAGHHPDQPYPMLSELTAESPWVLGPGESVSFTNTAMFDGAAFTISLWDGLSGTAYGTTQMMLGTQNTLPTANLSIDLGQFSSTRTASWTYEQIAAMLNASDTDGDALTITMQEMLDVGELKINGRPFAEVMRIRPGDTVTYTASGYQANSNGFKLAIEDGWGATVSTLRFSSAGFTVGGDIGDTTIIEGGKVASATAGYDYGTQAAAWRNAQGQLIISIEDLIAHTGGAPSRTTRNLSVELGLPALTGDPIVTGRYGTEIFIPTVSGTLLVGLTARHSEAAWDPHAGVYLRNLSVYNSAMPETNLTLVTPPSGTDLTNHMDLFYGLAGRSHDGDMVIAYGVDAMYGRSDAVEVFNVTSAVEAQSLTMPVLSDGFVAYAQSWGGYNIVGLDGAGDLVGAWSGGFYLPGDNGYNNIENSVWSVSNLTSVTNSPRLVGTLSVFSTDWNAINIIGTTEAGHAVASWWAPQMGAGNWSFVDFTDQFNGVPLQAGSLTGWVTPWGALNVAGVDSAGKVEVYWWFPTNMTEENPAGWLFEDLNSPTFDTGTHLTADSATFVVSGLNERRTRMSIYGVDADGKVGFTYWEPALGAEWAPAWA